MSSLKPMSAAQYRANAESVRAKQPTETVRLESGSVFELRRPDLHAYMMMGRLPKSLVAVGVKAWKEKQGTKQINDALSDEDALDAMIFMREIVHDCTVKPKFVEFATNDDEIGAGDMLREDFDEIFTWAMTHKGVAGIESLQTFRGGSERGASHPSADRKKRRKASQRDIETVGAV